MTNRQRRAAFVLCPMVGGLVYWFDPRRTPTITGALGAVVMTAVLYAALVIGVERYAAWRADSSSRE